MVAGKLGAVTEKLLLDTVALLTVTAADPEFVAVTVTVLVVPATTLPKSMLAFARDRFPICCWVSLGGLPALSPWQAVKKERPNRSINSCGTFREFFALPRVGFRAGEFGFIGGHEPPPFTASINSVSGEDCQQCGPMFPNKIDFGGTYLFRAEGQAQTGNGPLRPVEFRSFSVRRAGICRTRGRMELRLGPVCEQLIGGRAQAYWHGSIANIGNDCGSVFLVLS